MELVKKYFSWLAELLILLAVILVINNYLGNKDRVINADGKGYYDYLPAAFIYDDLNFNYLDTLQTNNYDHKMEAEGYIRQVDGKRIDKYFPGVAILWTPFFYGAHYYALNSDEFLANGYSLPYQKSIFYAALFFLFLGLLYLRKLLMELGINKVIIFAVQLLFALGTPLIHYVYNDSSFTHVYSFSLITIFAYLTYQFISYKNPKHLFLSGLVFGFIVIIRPVNIISLGIPLLFFGSFKELKTFLLELFKKHLNWVIYFGFIVGIIGSIVPILWHHQTGHFVVWGYQNEGFNFLSPAFFSFLFSFRKGMFLHTPLLFIAFFGGLWAFVAQKMRYQSAVYLGYFLVIVYILSSWWSWWYGASFGSRSIIDFYVIFAIGLANLFQYLKSTYSKVILGIIGLGLVGVNLIQAYQYKTYIIDYTEMTYDKFQKIGLHTEDKYRGLFYREITRYSEKEIVHSQEI